MPATKRKPTEKSLFPEAPPEPAWSLPSGYEYELPWDGTPFPGELLLLDTETEVVDPDDKPRIRRETPRLVLGSVSDGKRHAILTAGQLPRFLLQHRYRRFGFWNVGFDFRVIQRAVAGTAAARVLPEALDASRCHDFMLLEQLVRLARGEGEAAGDEGKFFRLDLGKAAAKYKAALQVSKKNPYRLTFGDLLKLPSVLDGERGYYDYAVGDTIVLAQLAETLWPLALELSRRFGVPEEKIERYGPLTEQIQVRAAVALAQVSLTGIAFDVGIAARLEAETRALYEERLRFFEEERPDLLKRYVRKDGGAYKRSKKTGGVQFNLKPMRQHLEAFAEQEGFEPPRSRGKLGLVSASEKDWSAYRDRSPLIDAWIGMKDREQHLAFFGPFREAHAAGRSRLHGDIDVLKRTGRIGMSNPNLTQAPKGSHFRDVFVAPPGKKIITIDFSYVELRTLAAVCEDRYGFSRLAETIRAGRDPHEHTASMLLGLPLDAFRATKASDPETYKRYRQSSKAVNFGCPGGLGAEKLAVYARQTYGVAMTVQEAALFREKLLNEVYPELALYLGDSTLEDWSANLSVPPGVLRDYCEFSCRKIFRASHEKMGMFFYCAGRILLGAAFSARSNQPYSPDFVKKLWEFVRGAVSLSPLPESAAWRELCDKESPDKSFYDDLFSQTAVTLTGRVRSRCGYTNARNTKFQGLAADGMKLALYDLVRDGVKVCLPVHDEFVVEVDAARAEADAKHVEAVMVRRMEEVMDGRVPAACSYVISNKWEKS